MVRILATLLLAVTGTGVLASCGEPDTDPSGRIVPSDDLVKALEKPAMQDLIFDATLPDGEDLPNLPTGEVVDRLGYVLTEVAWPAGPGDLWAVQITNGIWTTILEDPDGYELFMKALAQSERPVPASIAEDLVDRMKRDMDLDPLLESLRESPGHERDDVIDRDTALHALGTLGAEADQNAISLDPEDKDGIRAILTEAKDAKSGGAALKQAAAEWIEPVALLDAAINARPAATSEPKRQELLDAVRRILIEFDHVIYQSLPEAMIPAELPAPPDGQRADTSHFNEVDRLTWRKMLAEHDADWESIAEEAVDEAIAAQDIDS
ncbi:hypothetical protein ACIA03_08460 [Nocardioides sp. NPDC051685]|uniref:hypothetical protein n=1 Tax=Nocardioides sp. NPDC051685 TaxID=3364334 RepID=UPI0037A363A9